MVWLLLLSAACAFFGVRLFNALPAGWFSDYGEAPPENQRRLPMWAAALILPVLLAVVFLSAEMDFWPRIVLLLAAFICVLLAASDLLYRILPDQFTISLAGLGLLFALLIPDAVWRSLLAGIASGLLIFSLGLAGQALYKAEAMGFGDVKLVAALGLLAGWPGAVWGLLLSVLAGGLAAMPFLFRRGERRYLPFAPFLCGGFLAAVLWAEELSLAFQWYISLF